VRDLRLTAQVAEPGPVAVRASGSVAWRGDRLEVSDLRIDVPHGTVVADGTVGAVWDLGIRVDRLEPRALDPLFGDLGLGGVWVGSVAATGPPDRLTVAAGLRGVERSADAGAIALGAHVDVSGPVATWTATRATPRSGTSRAASAWTSST
jgi:autotransporter translocation and assembly factor TamB